MLFPLISCHGTLQLTDRLLSYSVACTPTSKISQQAWMDCMHQGQFWHEYARSILA